VRAADPAGLSSWASFLGTTANGSKRTQVARAFLGSAEAQTAQVDRLYQRYLFRPADPGGRLLWTSQLLSNPAFRLEDLIAGLAGSDEYWARRGASDNGKFIQAIYYDILRRPADPSGYTNWLSQLNNGTATRVQVATALAKSAEYYTGYINDQYQRLLGRGV